MEKMFRITIIQNIFQKNNMVHKKGQEIFLTFLFFCRLKNSHESTVSKVMERKIGKID
jgi:hypothetical protein